MVLRMRTSKVGLRSKEKQEAETGTQTLLEQSIWRKPWDGMGNPGGCPLAAGPRERAPLAGHPLPGGTPGTSAGGRDPAVTPRRARPTPREGPKQAAAQRRTAPSSLGRATRLAAPDAGGLL